MVKNIFKKIKFLFVVSLHLSLIKGLSDYQSQERESGEKSMIFSLFLCNKKRSKYFFLYGVGSGGGGE